MTMTLVTPAQAENFNQQFGPFDSNDGYGYIYSGADINSLAVWEDTDFPGEIMIAVFFEGWVGRSRFWYSDDYVMVTLDTNNDGVADYALSTEDAFYPSDREALETNVYTLDTVTIVSNCSAETWMPDGYSDSSDNWIAWSFDKSCLPLGPTMQIQAASSYLSYFDYTEFWSVNTGGAVGATPTYDLPTTKPLSAFKTPSPGQAPEDLVTLSPQMLESVVQVYCSSGVGSGWVAEAQLPPSASNAGFRSVVVTNHHVVENCLRSGDVSVVDSKGVTHAGKVFASDSENDLAGVYVQANLPKLAWQGEKPAQGWWVGVLGSPSQISGYLTTGIVGIIEESSGLLSVTAPIRPGNSGGPVFDREGRVIGVATAYLPDYENINIAGGVQLLCERVFSCPSPEAVWSTKLTAAPVSSPIADSEDRPLTGGTIVGGMEVQRAGSQVFITSADLQGDFEIYEDGSLVDTFTFDGINQAHIVEQRLTGAIQIRKIEGGTASLVSYEMTKRLLWFQNVNLGSFSETNLGSSATDKVSNLVNHKFLEDGEWVQRDSEVTKFICTGIYPEGGSAAEKLSARKKAKLACETAQSLSADLDSKVSFYYQTKETGAASYVGKVLVTVKGIEPFFASRMQ